MSRIREKLARFMTGRYGADNFSRFLIYTALALTLVNLLVSRLSSVVGSVISFVAYALLLLSLARMLSKNTYKRSAENRKYAEIVGKVKSFFRLQKDRIRERRTNVYRRCPKCRNVLRLPRKKGKHTVKCPCCSERFDINVVF